MSKIVVGIDGSHQSERALRWAAEEARLRGLDSVEAIHVYHVAESVDDALQDYPDGAFVHEPGYRSPEERWKSAHRRARDTVEAIVDSAQDDLAHVSIELHLVPSSNPAKELISRSRNAVLLVIGSRGLGGFKGLVLGSVSQQCVVHAACPVVVVRHDGVNAVV